VFQAYNGVTQYEQGQKSGLVSLSTSSVEEANVVTGGMGAEYRSATAGVVSYNLREGRGDLSGRVYVRMSQMGGLTHRGAGLYDDQDVYFAQKDALAASGDAANQEKASRFTYFPGKYPYKTRPEMQVDFGIGGQLSDQFRMYLAGNYFQSSYRLPNNSTKRIGGSLKMTYEFSADKVLSFTGLIEDRGRLLGWKNTTYSDDYRFFLEGSPQWDGINLVGSLKWTQTLSPSTFYTVALDVVSDQTQRGYSDDDGDGIITEAEAFTTDGDFMTFADTAQVNANMPRNIGTDFAKFFSRAPRNEPGSEVGVNFSGQGNWKIGRPGPYYEDFSNINYTLRADITSQVDPSHRLIGGALIRFHDFNMNRVAGYIGGVFPDYQNYVNEWWRQRPREYAVFVQDRMEYAGLIINVGLRLDGLDIDASDLDNAFAPFVNGSDAAGGPYRYVVREAENTEIKWFLSPRLGVSHPISENAAMYFSFSRQQQSQPFSQLYTNYNDFGNPSLPQLMRSNQDPIHSTNYDLGIQWSFAQNWGLDLAAYYKDIDNYRNVGLSVAPAAPWRQYIITTNFGYADSRGVELTLRLNPTRVADWLTIGGRFAYAYTYIKQSGSAGANTSSFSTAAGDSATYSGNVPWDDLRYWNVIEQNVQGGASTLTGGYDRPNRIMYTLFMQFPAYISLNLIGTHSDGFWFRQTLSDIRSRALGQGPWNHNVDLRLEFAPVFGDKYRVAFFVDVINALNSVNIIGYNTSNVGQLAWETEGNPEGGATIQRPVGKGQGGAGADGSLVYDVPREVYFGVNFTF
jgi:outer membrane receptor protein involved in Fe transport